MVLVALILSACAGELATPGEALRLLGSELPDAVVAEPYRAQFHAVGGLRPYQYSLASGALPTGMELQGGELRGVPNATGEATFGIEVSDANLSKTFQEYTLLVITPPAPALDLQLPDTEVRGEVRVRARVSAARSLVGLRTSLTWDAELFSLKEGSVSASRADVALLHEANAGGLRVDLALLGTTLEGDAELFAFTLVPTETPTTLSVGSVSEFASAAGPDFRFEFAETLVRATSPAAALDEAPEIDPDEEQPESPDPKEDSDEPGSSDDGEA